MTKTPKQSVIIILVLFIIIICLLSLEQPKDKAQIYRNMINNEFSTSLDSDNSTLRSANTILSRDSVYVICFDIDESVVSNLLNIDIEWTDDIDLLLQRYLLPHQQFIGGIDEIIHSVKEDKCVYRINIQNDVTGDFKLLVLDPDEKTLFFFYYTT